MSQGTDWDRDEIVRARAYAIWMDEGCPEGRADIHWRMALDALETEDAAEQPLQDTPEAPAPLAPPNR